VGLEPSCVAVFRDELRNLFPENVDAERLSRQTYTLAEFLEQKAEGYKPPTMRRKALLHGHCHHKAVMKLTSEERLLKAIGLELEVLDSGCCGMAGSFGFESGKYDISMKCGERVLLPAVRRAAKDTLILADGFSCKEQIVQATGRGGLHIAQVLQMAMREGLHGPRGNYPERGYVRPEGEEPAPGHGKWAALAAGGALAAGAIYLARSGRR
jgi:Fe-S oxidoreductase